MIMTFRPLSDRVLVARPKARVEVTVSGLYIPEVATHKTNEGVVVAIGDGAITRDGVRLPVDLAVGDRVLFGKYVEQDVKVFGLDPHEYVMLRETDVLAVLSHPIVPSEMLADSAIPFEFGDERRPWCACSILPKPHRFDFGCEGFPGAPVHKVLER